jgi:hypothetical protein
MDERWLAVPGYEGHYEVSDMGRVRSLDRLIPTPRAARGDFRKSPGRVLRQTITTRGYPFVTLCKDGTRAVMTIHKMVLAAFVGPRPDGMVTRHLNGDPSDNRLENLTYGTPKENMHDMIVHGTNYYRNRTHCRHGHPYSGRNLIVGKNGTRACRTCRSLNEPRYRATYKAKKRANA